MQLNFFKIYKEFMYTERILEGTVNIRFVGRQKIQKIPISWSKGIAPVRQDRLKNKKIYKQSGFFVTQLHSRRETISARKSYSSNTFGRGEYLKNA